MKPLLVRELSDPERHAVQAGLRSSDGFTVRRCHILLPHPLGLRARRHRPRDRPSRRVQSAGGAQRPASLREPRAGGGGPATRRPHTAAKVFDIERSQRLKALLHQSPRQFGKARSTWTLALAAEVCAEHGITAEPVSYETIRDALKRLGVGWRRAKTWITSPDPQYALKKTGVTA